MERVRGEELVVLINLAPAGHVGMGCPICKRYRAIVIHLEGLVCILTCIHDTFEHRVVLR